MAESNTNQVEEQRKAQAQQDAARKAEEQRTSKANAPGDASRRGVEAGHKAARERYDREKQAVSERPQQVGNEDQQPTPTQQENDEIRAGLRHIDEKEDDGSGPDPRFAMRRIDAEQGDQGYKTR